MRAKDKQRALEAYVDGQLSTEGERRVRRLLDRHSVLRERLAVMHVYRDLVEEERELDTFHGLENRERANWKVIRGRITLDTKHHRMLRSPLLWMAAACAVLAGMVGLRALDEGAGGATDFSQSTPRLLAVLEHPPFGVALASINVLGGRSVALRRGDDELPAAVGMALLEGDEIVVGEGSTCQVRFEDGTQTLFFEKTNAVLRRKNAGEVSWDQKRGELTHEVTPRLPGGFYEVMFGGWTASVRGTRFVTGLRDPGGRGIVVSEGTVVLRQGPDLERVLSAPASVFSKGWSEGDAERWHRRSTVVFQEPGTGQGRQQSTVVVPDLGRHHDWFVNGTPLFAVNGPLRMRAKTGTSLTLLGEEHREIHVVFDGGGRTMVSETLLGARQGWLAPRAIARVVKAGMGRLRQCYERYARETGNTRVTLRMRIMVHRSGRVERVSIRPANQAPDTFGQCIRTHAARWSFPAPEGGAVTFDQPLHFEAVP